MKDKIEMVISGRERDIGGFTVRRILPYAKRKTVGPFIFFDHMGPSDFAPGHGLDVRPHPHIGLATVTYLFEGAIFHRDSLGVAQKIEPGAINWMTAGRGIVHSERSPDDHRQRGSRLEGIQCWVALPKEHEEIEPSFVHYPADTIPEFDIGAVNLRLLVGRAFERQSPVKTLSDLFYLEAKFNPGSHLTLIPDGREVGLYVVRGQISIAGGIFNEGDLAIAAVDEQLEVLCENGSHVMIFGGAPIDGPREIWWNFVSSTKERLERAKAEWREGKFPTVPNDEQEFIPLPDEPPETVPAKPRGTVL